MALTNPNKVITEERLHEFYLEILPYLGGNKAVDSNPVGHFGFFLLPSAPAGYLECKGQRLSATAFPLLFNALKEFPAETRATWGAGDADWVTEFDLPDMRGEFPRVSGINSHDNQGSGANVGVHQDGTTSPHIVYSDRYLNAYADNDASITNSDYNSGSSTRAMDLSVAVNTTADWALNQMTRYASRPTNTSLLGCVKYTYVIQEVEYSLEERIIGVWKQTMDDILKQKPLYQKTVVFNNPSTEWGTLTSWGIANISQVIEVKPIYDFGTWHAANEFYESSTNYLQALWQGYGFRLSAAGDAKNHLKSITITLKYTKTTDQWRTV